MYSILRELYCRDFSPHFHSLPTSAEYKETRADYSKDYHSFRDKLGKIDPDLKRDLDIVIDKCNATFFLESEDLFERAFIFGCRLMLEVMEYDWSELSQI